MAQLVKLEPGDILVLANVGAEVCESLLEAADRLKGLLGVDRIWVFEGPIDLSKVPSDAVAGP